MFGNNHKAKYKPFFGVHEYVYVDHPNHVWTRNYNPNILSMSLYNKDQSWTPGSSLEVADYIYIITSRIK